jgi:hypothetical protein
MFQQEKRNAFGHGIEDFSVVWSTHLKSSIQKNLQKENDDFRDRYPLNFLVTPSLSFAFVPSFSLNVFWLSFSSVLVVL